ncbi:valine--tRNA ligase [Candidatus Saccharibacteria bacterium]|nr:valine--tRNA ligase [Candidatus Saccharibacteria bacterium]
MSLPKTYEPSNYEPTTYALWEVSGVFKPKGKGQPYGIVMPPPNANGNLHVGHALSFDLEDMLVRYHRMIGEDAVLIPGSDHAGFETWVVYEKELQKQGKTRFDYSREELYGQVWDFVEARRGDVGLQLRALGVGADWENSVFTLDTKVIATVYETFHKLWEEGLIYRGERIVNYCTHHQTSFADIEVVHKEEKGKLWHIAYPLLDKVGEIVVATTRPETMLGDTAIAVHPNDERYKDMIGMQVQVPLVHREIPIVADEAVDMSFGTGAVKVTPAHDPTDFEIGKRHDLSVVEVITTEGKISPEASQQFAHQDIAQARAGVVNMLEAEEIIRKVENHVHNVGHCYKCGTTIEPLIKDQWFLRIGELAKPAIKSIEAGEVKFVPASKGKLVVQYLKNLRDWNLSRQIPWGIPIPAFQNEADHSDWVFDTRVDDETIEVNGKTYRREEDTFDTWFSSSQWPYIVTNHLQDMPSGMPGASLKRFYPNSVMETGHDLLDRWVARMIMMGLYRTGKVPFEEVYMHGMVLDEKGQKMSKSKGNVLNPMEVIAKYGSDALRLGVIMNRSAGQNQAFSPATVVAGRNFCNKLWNIARFIEPHVEKFGTSKPEAKSLADHWVLARLDTARKDIDSFLKQYRFAEAADLMYHTIWGDVADWYLEASKTESNRSVLTWVLETSLKLAHPFAPFVTETIWSTMEGDRPLLAESAWPKKPEYDIIAAGEFDRLCDLVSEIRFVSSDLPGAKQALLYGSDVLVADNSELIKRLGNLKEIKSTEQPQGLRLAVPGREVWLDVEEDVMYEHQTKLELRLAECRDRIVRLQTRLDNSGYVDKAPKAVVEQTREELKEQIELERRLGKELDVIED